MTGLIAINATNLDHHHRKNRASLFSGPPDYAHGNTSGAEVDQESNGSSVDDVESPRSVVGKGNFKNCFKVRAHSQILRIRAEDSHLGEDIGEGNLSVKDKLGVSHFMVFSRPILPASPLGSKTDR